MKHPIYQLLASVHPEIVDFGFWQGPNIFKTAGIARYVEDFKMRERRQGPKDAISG